MFKKIYVEITNICNLECEFCLKTNRKKKYMNIEEFEHIIEKIYKYTKLICLHVKGEPLLHPNLKEILTILDKYDLKANITTNGTLIKENIDILKKSESVRQINFSLHSITQNKKMDINYLKEIFESANELSNIIISYRLWNLENLIENDGNNNIILELEKYYNLFNLKENLKVNEYIKIKDKLYINQDVQFKWPNINENEINESGRCLAIKDQIAILVDGSVVPCCLDNNGDILLGNIYEETIEDILNKEKTKQILNNFKNGVITCDLCKTCGFLKRLEEKRIKI